MTQQHHLNHATWDCKYHVVFIPKYRKKAIFGKIKKNLGTVFPDLARRRHVEEVLLEKVVLDVAAGAMGFAGAAFPAHEINTIPGHSYETLTREFVLGGRG